MVWKSPHKCVIGGALFVALVPGFSLPRGQSRESDDQAFTEMV